MIDQLEIIKIKEVKSRRDSIRHSASLTFSAQLGLVGMQVKARQGKNVERRDVGALNWLNSFCKGWKFVLIRNDDDDGDGGGGVVVIVDSGGGK